ncbi:MAG: hypothetical protein J6X55_02525 [Victivallales bacterium]|nr:hypothetical protein [Victivallales bacterium]
MTIFSIDKTQNPPRLLKDGKPVFPMLFWQTSIEERDGRAFSEAGIELFTFTRSFQAYEHPFYVAEDTYDFSFFDGEIEKFRRACPGKYCIPRVFVGAPYWWLDAHPEECCQYALPTEIHKHGFQFKDCTQGTYHESYASELWKRDMGKALRMLIRHIKASDYADCVVGLHIANGHCGEWHYWSAGKMPDVSAPMRAYTGDADATPEKRNWEYYDRFFQAEYDAIIHFARIVREETNGTYLNVGFYCYQPGNNIESAHRAAEKILAAPEIDILTAPHSYHYRAPGDDGYFRNFLASVAAHGKLFIDESDDRTNLSLKKIHPMTRPLGASTHEDSLMLIRREFGNALTHNVGLWYMDIDDNAFHDDEFMAEIAKLYAWGVKSMEKPRPRRSEVAVFFDMRGAYYLPKSYLNIYPFCSLNPERITHLCRAGAPFDFYLAGDVCLPEIRNYKVLIFIDLIAPSADVRRAIDSLKGEGRTFIWSYSSGLYDIHNEPNVQNMAALTGIDDFQMVDSVNLPESFGNGAPTMRPGILPIETERDFGTWRSIYTWYPDISIEKLRTEYARAGVWNYLDTTDVLQVSDGALMVHATEAGPKTIHLPKPKNVTDITTNEVLGELQNWTMELNAHETRIFLLD